MGTGRQDAVQHPERIFYSGGGAWPRASRSMPLRNESPSIAVERALAILEDVSHHRDGMTNAEVSRRLGIPKSSASYILRTLEKRGYLRRQVETGRYRLGLKVLSLGREVLAGFEIGDLALPILRAVVERTQLTAHLAILDHGEAVYIAKVDAPGFIKMDTWVGRRMFVHSTSVGKALVAALPRTEVEAILRQHGLKKRTPKTIGTPARFFAELEKVGAQGYAVDDEENSLGARCLAVPIFDVLGRVVAAMGISGTTTQIDEAHTSKLVELLRDAARRLTRQLTRTSSATS